MSECDINAAFAGSNHPAALHVIIDGSFLCGGVAVYDSPGVTRNIGFACLSILNARGDLKVVFGRHFYVVGRVADHYIHRRRHRDCAGLAPHPVRQHGICAVDCHRCDFHPIEEW